ncbi:MAG: hypothetical protein ACRER1_01410 [Gammaproteobacteria bacterium]
MNSKFVPALLLLAATPLAFAAQSSANKTDATKIFRATAPATGLTGVKLTAGVGTVHVTTSNTDTVSIKATANPGNHMHFIFDWTTGASANALPADLHLVTRREGSQLVVSLATDAGSAASAESANSGHDTNRLNINGHTYTTDDHSGWKADWTLVLPARLALDLTVGVGKAEISGVGGGVRAKIGVGKLNAQLPQGPMEANVGVGNVKAFIASADYGKVKLTAGVGRVEFDVNGQRNKTGYEKHFTAAEQQVNGGGKTDFTLKAGVGHVDLEIGVKDLPKPNDEDEQDDK